MNFFALLLSVRPPKTMSAGEVAAAIDNIQKLDQRLKDLRELSNSGVAATNANSPASNPQKSEQETVRINDKIADSKAKIKAALQHYISANFTSQDAINLAQKYLSKEVKQTLLTTVLPSRPLEDVQQRMALLNLVGEIADTVKFNFAPAPEQTGDVILDYFNKNLIQWHYLKHKHQIAA